MEAKGYEIKNAEFGENSRKYITFRSPDMSHPVRGSTKSLGKNFTKERIKERINNKLHRTTVPSVRNKLIDTNTPNIAGNIGLQKWANKENLKIVSAEYNKMLTHNLHNFSELEDRIALLHMQQKEVNTSVVSLESQIRHLREMTKICQTISRKIKFTMTIIKVPKIRIVISVNMNLKLFFSLVLNIFYRKMV
mgnify:CR=1 FL=1